MGLTKEYLRYAPTNIFGIISSSRCNLKLIKFRGTYGKHIAVGACEYVFIWDLRKNYCVLKLSGESQTEAVCIEQDTKSSNLAIGYLDGSIRLFNLNQDPDYVDDYTSQLSIDAQCIRSFLTFNGHKASITTISFDANGSRLISGSKDNEIVMWDLIGEYGLFRLKGHKAAITKAILVPGKSILISSSKDKMVKFWDINTRHCFKTLINHRSEITDLTLTSENTRLITGCQDNELRVYELIYKDDSPQDKENETSESNHTNGLKNKQQKLNGSEMEVLDKDQASLEDEIESSSSTTCLVECRLIGSIVRESKDSLSHLCVDNTATLLGFHSSNEKHVEIYKINSEQEVYKKLLKRIKKHKRQLGADSENRAQDESIEVEKTMGDEFTRICQVKSKHKIKSFDMFTEMASKNAKKRQQMQHSANDNDDELISDCMISCLLENNQIEIYLVKLKKQINTIEPPSLISRLDHAGHRTDVRTISFNSDSSAFMSASAESMKVWNRMSLKPIRTFSCDYALSSLFLSDDNHIIIGTKSGKIQLFNINQAVMIENIIGHEEDSSIWSLCLIPDKSGFISGGSDKTVRFWKFELIDDDVLKNKKRLTFTHSKTLKVDEDVLSVKISPNNRYIAVALLDTTVKIFFMDSLKLFLNLYGHKQPVLSMDISFDNRLLVTGSADRHLKIWGLDFGDCHRSINAHEESIMNVQFVGKTHYFFSVSKDGKLKEWDADKFERIITLEGHLYEIWSLAISHDGKYVLTGSHDKSIRLWEKTNEPLVLEDERETEKEKQLEKDIPKEEQVIAGETNQETGLATIKTIETIKSAEKLIESLNIFNEEKAKKKEFLEARERCANDEERSRIKLDPKHTLLVAYGDISEEEFVLQTLKKTKSSEIETTLLVLEFEHSKILLELLLDFVNKNMEVELCLRCIIFLLKINFGQITTTQTLLPFVKQLRTICYSKLSDYQNTIGFNLSATKFFKQKLNENSLTHDFGNLSLKSSKDKNKKKQKNSSLIVLKSASSVS